MGLQPTIGTGQYDGDDLRVQGLGLGVPPAGQELSLAEVRRALAKEIKDGGLKIDQSGIYTIGLDQAEPISQELRRALITCVWRGGCVGITGGPAGAAMFGYESALAIAAYEGCSSEDIKQVVSAVNRIVKSDSHEDIEIVSKSESDPLAWGSFCRSQGLESVKTEPVRFMRLDFDKQAFRITHLAEGSGDVLEELLRLKHV